MCMVAVSDKIIQEAIETNTIKKDFSQEYLSGVVEELLEEKIKAKRRKRILDYEGSCIWEGDLEEMRSIR